MTRLSLALLVAGLALPLGPAHAQDQSPQPSTPMPAPSSPSAPAQATPKPAQAPTEPGTGDGRYTFHRLDDSFVRLDTRTGQVSACRRGDAGWACQAVPDERSALESEIGRLQADNAALKAELLARGLPLPGGVKANPPSAKGPDVARTPSDAQIDNAMAVLERVWRRMVEIMANTQRELQQPKN